jgi:hypothetical protein
MIYKNLYQLTGAEQKAPGNSEVHRSLQIYGPSAWNSLHVTPLRPTVLRWLLLVLENLWVPEEAIQLHNFFNLCIREDK